MPQPAIAQSRVCSDCKTDKPLADYANDKNRLLGKEYICKPCKNARHIKRKYGLTSQQHKEMSDSTPHCPICGSEEPLVVDHDHSTLEVRGLICHNCNVGLGQFKDNIQSLKNAIAYLEQ